MTVSIDIRDDLPDEALEATVAWLHAVDATYSTYRPDSPISRLGRGELSLDDLDAEVLGVLSLCEDLYEDTHGAFDILAVPAPNGAHLDPSGLVKGWSIERAVEILESFGARNLCINAGGDIAMRGETAPGEPWRIGVRHPSDERALAKVLDLRGRTAVATSATYERGAHIIDPRTGLPTTDLASVTVVGTDLTYVDAYATALFVMGLDGLTWLMNEHPECQGFAVTHEDLTYATPGLIDLVVDPAVA